MPTYHSQFDDTKIQGFKVLGNIPVLPIKNTDRKTLRKAGSVTSYGQQDSDIDIVDEALDLFKANVFFNSYEIKLKADRVLVYSFLYIILCLKKLARCSSKAQAHTDMYTLALSRFALPGDADFPLNAFIKSPKSAAEKEELKKYMTLLRQEIGSRLVERVFDPAANDGEVDKPSKWWICFSRRKFLKVELNE